jgi:hypothetical protein
LSDKDIFKIGDRVEIISNKFNFNVNSVSNDFRGKIGEITFINNLGLCDVKLSKGTFQFWGSSLKKLGD